MGNLKKTRQSNIELLRLICMMMIIGIHYWTYSGVEAVPVEKGFSGITPYFFYEMTRCLFVAAVDIFVLITGYFSVNSKVIKINKITDIIIQTAFWGVLAYLALVFLTDGNPFSAKEMVKNGIMLSGWFGRAYIILLLLIPFYNIIIAKLSKKSYLILLAILTVLFSLWPTFLPEPPVDDYGFGFINLSFMYFIGGFLRKHMKKLPSKTVCIIAFVISWGLSVFSRRIGLGYAWAYNFVPVIIEAISLFLLFCHFKFSSKIINFLSSCSFGVFLIHFSEYLRGIIYGRMFHAKQAMSLSTGKLALYLLGSIAVFTVVAIVLELIRKLLFKYTADKLLNLIPVYRKNIEIK